jgi:glycosyltransferase involved in cell wall biosynthesis
MPKLSIITINYNNASGLDQTIQSVINQTFSDFEYIIIDGASTDNSVEIIKKYEQKISFWSSEKDTGVYNAMNKGIKKAGGEYCLFLNSGDYLAEKDILTKVFSTKSNADIIYGNMLIDYLNGKKEKGKMPPQIDLYQMYVDTLWHPVSFIKRELFEKYGYYDESYKIVADYEFFFKVVIQKKVSLYYVPLYVSVFVFNGLSSDSKNKEQEKEERKKVWSSYLSATEINQLETERIKRNEKKGKIIYRIINKLKF